MTEIPSCTEPWKEAEDEMKAAGFGIDKIPRAEHERHMWAEGLFLFWHRHKRLPTEEELCNEMLDEWDDPVSLNKSAQVLALLKA